MLYEIVEDMNFNSVIKSIEWWKGQDSVMFCTDEKLI